MDKVNKKWAILIIVAAMAVIYLLLLVGIPALADMVPPCGSGNCTSWETANSSAISEATANWTAVRTYSPPDVRPYREIYRAPWIIYSIPGLVGICLIVVILTQKQGGK